MDGRTGSGAGEAAGTGTPPAPAPEHRFSLGQIVILGSLAGLPPLAIDLYLPALPSLTRALHAAASTGQLTLTTFVAGMAAGQLVAGALSDAYGRRRPLLLGLGGYVAATALCAAAPSVWTLLVLRAIEGAAGGAGVVIGRAVVRDRHSGGAAARVFAAMLVVTGAAPVIGPLLGGQLLRVTDWRGLFAALAAVGALQLLGVAAWLGETLPVERRHRGGLRVTLARFGVLLRDRRFVADAGALTLAFGAFFAYISASSFLLEDIYRVSPQSFSYIFALLAVSFVITGNAGARLVARAGARRLFLAGLTLCGVASAGALAAIATGAGLGALIVSLALVNVGNGLVWPNGTAVAMAESGEIAGSASALMGVSQFALAAVVAPLVGIAGSRAALPTGVVMCVCGVAACALYATGGRRSAMLGVVRRARA
jgi:DHA1 family bicyclomycin/chloramphenicol resistance-like MFS transporter